MFGDLPPSSSDTFLSVFAARAISCLPTSVDPVKAMASTPGWSTRALPTTLPRPGTTFSTPAGSPHSFAYSANFSSDSAVFEAGLITTVFPRQRRSDLPHRQHQREVPRRDRADDADRLAQRVREGVLLHRDRVAEDFSRPSREGVEALGCG